VERATVGRAVLDEPKDQTARKRFVSGSETLRDILRNILGAWRFPHDSMLGPVSDIPHVFEDPTEPIWDFAQDEVQALVLEGLSSFDEVDGGLTACVLFGPTCSP